MIGGRNNPIDIASRAIEARRELMLNIRKKQDIDADSEDHPTTDHKGKQYNPNVTTSFGPLIGDSEDGLDLGGNRKQFDLSLPKPEFQSGMILVDSGLYLLKALSDEYNILSIAGLEIEPTDDVRVIKNKAGEIVGAITFGTKHVNQIQKIRYIDVDEASSNFKQCMCKLAQQESATNPLRFYSNSADITRNEIPNKFIIRNS